jgi:restriction system protein
VTSGFDFSNLPDPEVDLDRWMAASRVPSGLANEVTRLVALGRTWHSVVIDKAHTDEWQTYMSSDPLAARRVMRLAAVASRVALEQARDIGIMPSNPAASSALSLEIAGVSYELKRALGEDPTLIHQLPWQKFEEVVAELLATKGFSVTRVPIGQDRGVDIFAADKNAMGQFLYLVQCKRFDLDNPVDLKFVDRLYGKVMAENATAGMVATTSRFTRGAVEFAERFKFQISLRDYKHIYEWLDDWKT